MRALFSRVLDMKKNILAYFLLTIALVFSVNSFAAKPQKMYVTATAYNSVRAQTNSNPSIAAWGDRLKPGMKAIAVSRDLLKKGLKRGVKVKISGLPGEYVVLDKMHHR